MKKIKKDRQKLFTKKFWIILIFLIFSRNLAATITVISNANRGSNILREALSNARSGDLIRFNLPSRSTRILLDSALPFTIKI